MQVPYIDGTGDMVVSEDGTRITVKVPDGCLLYTSARMTLRKDAMPQLLMGMSPTDFLWQNGMFRRAVP